MIKKLTLLIIASLLIHNIYSKSFYSIDDGNWNDGTIWSYTSGGGVANDSPTKGDDVHIEGHDIILTEDLSNNPGIELYVTLGGSLTGPSYSILIATQGNLDISNGIVHVASVTLKNGAIVDIEPDGILITDQFLTNEAEIIVDGSLEIGTVFNNSGTVTGGGTITANSYNNTGTLFGITTNPVDGYSMSGYIWDGETSTDWQTATNWSQDLTPSASTHNVLIPSGIGTYPVITTIGNNIKDITIETGATLDINPTYSLTVNGNLANSGTLTIKSSSTGTGSLLVHGTSTGNVVVERYLTD